LAFAPVQLTLVHFALPVSLILNTNVYENFFAGYCLVEQLVRTTGK
jgi:hypothetical protein